MSLSALDWTDIPPLAIVTGLNGVGKTQFLRLLAIELDALRSGPETLFARPAMQIEPRPASVGYLPAIWQHGAIKISHEFFEPVGNLLWRLGLRSPDIRNLDELVQFNVQSITGRLRPIAARFVDVLRSRGRFALPISRADALAALDTYDLVVRNPEQPLFALAQIFYAHANARVTALLRGVALDQIDTCIGNSPLEQTNRLLDCFEMRFRLIGPDDPRFAYELLCHLPGSNVTLPPGELSSGEQAVLALIAMVVMTSVLGPASSATEQNPELLLLDEPDSHLHTSGVKSYLEHVRQLTSDGMQIIMITHRPDTIVLAPDGSLFEMRREHDRTSIVKVHSKSELIGRLAADTIAVLPGVRVVLVEDDDDRRFHQWAYDRALKLGLLPANPRLVFMPVHARGGGGKDAVMKRLAVLRNEGLAAIHRGLVDHDNAVTLPPEGVVSLQRYALENYLADPVALYCAVVNAPSIDKQLQFAVAGGVDRGELGSLRSADVGSLQRIADLVFGKLEEAATLVDRERSPITLHGDAGKVVLMYPRWLFTTSKKDLRTAIDQRLCKAVLSEDHFHGGPELSGIVPDDLVEVYRHLVTDRGQGIERRPHEANPG
jgi:hypothetical protein